ncbi:MAG TPA: hypothetical protein VN602_07600 [Gemmatimonadaceae bacterium]|nr:hypothetical protein [Gemmatimonadaceae bacterium]
MATPRSLIQQMQIVQVLQPATDAAGRTGAYLSVKNSGKVAILVQIQQGNAATVALNLLQAQDVAGTGSKALVASQLAVNLDESTSDLLVAQAAASTYTTDAGLKNKIVVFEVDEAALDIANGFRTVTVQTGASNVANVTSAVFLGYAERYAGATMPSAILN